jgi:hypothetical protein
MGMDGEQELRPPLAKTCMALLLPLPFHKTDSAACRLRSCASQDFIAMAWILRRNYNNEHSSHGCEKPRVRIRIAHHCLHGGRRVTGVPTVAASQQGITVMKSLPIIWQRLVSSDGKTCDRCKATYQEMQRAISKLMEVLRPLGIEPTLETREIDEQSFRAHPSESNRIWIAGRPMEEWLGARVGSSRCCAVCGESACRTVEVEAATFEAIPEGLFLKAALVAAAQLLDLTTAAPSR